MATSIIRFDEKKFEERNAELQALIHSIDVKDSDTCLQMKTAMRDIRTEIKLRKFVLDPFVQDAKDGYDKARDRRSKWIDPLQKLDDSGELKVKDFERKERERTEREAAEHNRLKREAEAREADRIRKEQQEQARIECEQREKEIAAARKAGELKAAEAKKLQKQAEQEQQRKAEEAAFAAQAAKDNFVPDKVLPNIPTVSGVPSRRNYKAEVTHPERLINAFLDAVHLRNTERAVYLRRFIMVNEQELGVEARTVKNPKQLEAAIPGVRFYEE